MSPKKERFFSINRRYIISRISFILAVFLVSPVLASAASLTFSPISASHSVNQTFNVRVEVNPDGEGVNAVESELNFDSTKLSVVSVSKTGSAFSLWTTEPEFSNSAGTINFGGGSPTPFSRTSTLVTITFKALSPGAAEVGFNSASVLAADGLGTDVYEEGKTATYTITEAVVAPPPPPPPTPAGNRPPAPVIESPSHPDENAWYQDDTAEFSWDIPNGVTTVRILLGSEPESDPTVPYTPPIDTRIIDNLDEGISYLHVDYRNDVGYGDTTHRKIQIDKSPPDEFEIEVVPASSTTSPPFISFEAIDAISDIERYEISVANEEPVILTKDQHGLLPPEGWELPRLFDGTYLVVVKAVDLAGNERESDVSVILETGYVDTPPESQATEEMVERGFNWWFLVSLILLALVLFLVFVIYMQRARFLKERDYLRRETKEVRQKMEKIFSVLQDELEEQIRSLDKKPRLSADEKRVLKSMREALEVSEAFINKEIEDVEKVLI